MTDEGKTVLYTGVTSDLKKNGSTKHKEKLGAGAISGFFRDGMAPLRL